MTPEFIKQMKTMRDQLTSWHEYITQLLRQLDGVDLTATQRVWQTSLKLLAGQLGLTIHAARWAEGEQGNGNRT